ncbi:hypothetical protein QOT17_021827 [Balamuthia mandrillaris]
MSATFLQGGSYFRYKRDNSRVARWLWTVYHDSRQRILSARDGNNKDKEKLKEGGSSTTHGAARPSTKLSPDDLSRMVPTLCEAIEAGLIEVPNRFFLLLHNTIQARLRHYQRYVQHAGKLTGQSKEDVEQRNQSHKYYVDALQNAFERLGGGHWLAGLGTAKEEESPSGSSAPSSSSPTNDCADSRKGEQQRQNYYELLEVEEEETKSDAESKGQGDNKAQTEGMSAVSNGPRNRKKNKKRQQQRADVRRAPSIPLHEFEIVNESETFFAVACFLNDLSDIRAFVKAVWQEYAECKKGASGGEQAKNRRMGLSMAALLTNFALQAVARMEIEFYIMFPTFSSFEDILKELSLAVKAPTERKEEEEFADWMLAFPCYALKEFSTTLRPGRTSMPKDGYFGIFRPERDRSIMSQADRIKEDLNLLFQHLGYWATCAELSSFPSSDTASKSQFYWDNAMVGHMRQFCKDRRFTVHLLVALSIFLDCIHICRRAPNNIQRSYQEMRAGMAEVFLDLDWYVTHKFQYKFIQGDDGREVIQKSMQLQRSLMEDPLRELCRTKAELQSSNYTKGDLFRFDPWTCGACLLSQQAEVYYLGVQIINGTGFFLTMAHLHHALVTTGRLDPIEPVQKIIEALRHRLFCLSDLPETPSECLTTLCFSLGVRPESFARNKHNKKHTLQYNPAGKGLKEDDSLCYYFERYGKLSKDWEDRLAPSALSSSKPSHKKKEMSGNDGSKGSEEKEEEEENKEKEQTDQANNSCEAVERLERLKALLQERTNDSISDLVRLNFFALHHFAMDVISKVYEDTRDDICLALGSSDLLDHPHQMPFVVGYIFMAAKLIPLTPTSLSGTIWANAAQAFQSVAASWDMNRFIFSRSGF